MNLQPNSLSPQPLAFAPSQGYLGGGSPMMPPQLPQLPQGLGWNTSGGKFKVDKAKSAPTSGGIGVDPQALAGMGMLAVPPFGGFRRRGGPVLPGVGYVVGEGGAELFVPQMPGMVLPNETLTDRAPAAGSRMGGPLSDRGPAGVQSGPLSSREATPTGRGMTAARRMKIAERRLVSQGDVMGAARMAGTRQWAEMVAGRNAMPKPPPMMMPMAMPNAGRTAPMLPTGTDEDGFQLPLTPQGVSARAPLPPPVDLNPQPGMGEPVPMMSSPLGLMPPPQPNVPAGFFQGQQAAGMPAPAPGLYTEAPPLLSSAPIPGTDQVMPLVMGEPKGGPVARAQPKAAPDWTPPKMYDETIPEVRDAQGNVKSPARTRQYYFVQDPKTGRPMKEYALDANGDGVPDNQQPGWMNWLQGQQ